jgi:hypothetical protein
MRFVQTALSALFGEKNKDPGSNSMELTHGRPDFNQMQVSAESEQAVAGPPVYSVTPNGPEREKILQEVAMLLSTIPHWVDNKIVLTALAERLLTDNLAPVFSGMFSVGSSSRTHWTEIHNTPADRDAFKRFFRDTLYGVDQPPGTVGDVLNTITLERVATGYTDVAHYSHVSINMEWALLNPTPATRG